MNGTKNKVSRNGRKTREKPWEKAAGERNFRVRENPHTTKQQQQSHSVLGVTETETNMRTDRGPKEY